MDESKIHKGHRQRLKDKVRLGGLKVLSEHEILELLLTYTIPYKDTNGLAHNLINRFDSIAGVIDADYNELVNIVGVGNETALFMKVLQDFVEVYKKSKAGKKEIKVSSIADIIAFFRSTKEIKKKEHLYVYGVSKRNTIVKSYEVEGLDDCEVGLNLKDIISNIFVDNVSSVFIVHTHPHGSVLPSMADIETTKNFRQICEMLGLVLNDHVIINESDYFSFRQNGMLGDKRSKQYDPNDFDNRYISDKHGGRK